MQNDFYCWGSESRKEVLLSTEVKWNCDKIKDKQLQYAYGVRDNLQTWQKGFVLLSLPFRPRSEIHLANVSVNERPLAENIPRWACSAFSLSFRLCSAANTSWSAVCERFSDFWLAASLARAKFAWKSSSSSSSSSLFWCWAFCCVIRAFILAFWRALSYLQQDKFLISKANFMPEVWSNKIY